jgi:hypothetical protein
LTLPTFSSNVIASLFFISCDNFSPETKTKLSVPVTQLHLCNEKDLLSIQNFWEFSLYKMAMVAVLALIFEKLVSPNNS